MKPNNFHIKFGTELSPDQLHALHLNNEGKLEMNNCNNLNIEEIEALQRIQLLLDELKFGRDTE